jgi:hypothetical protein
LTSFRVSLMGDPSSEKTAVLSGDLMARLRLHDDISSETGSRLGSCIDVFVLETHSDRPEVSPRTDHPSKDTLMVACHPGEVQNLTCR